MTQLCRTFATCANDDADEKTGFDIRRQANATVVFDRLVIDKPDGNGAPMINFGSYRLTAGDRMMLTGPSGCGKSSALCALKDAWIFGGSGGMTLPQDDYIKFVPQEDYFPDLTLRDMVCAPRDASQFTDAQVEEALTEAGLAEFIPQMKDEDRKGQYWKDALSGGQKKRMLIAGVFLQAPQTKLLILDEVTSALDAEAEKTLYANILGKMRHGVVISIVHRMEIAPMHNIFATVADGKVNYDRKETAIVIAPSPWGSCVITPGKPEQARYPRRPWKAL